MTMQTVSKRRSDYLLASLTLVPASVLMAYCFSAVSWQAWQAEPDRPNYPDSTLVEPRELPAEEAIYRE